MSAGEKENINPEDGYVEPHTFYVIQNIRDEIANTNMIINHIKDNPFVIDFKQIVEDIKKEEEDYKAINMPTQSDVERQNRLRNERVAQLRDLRRDNDIVANYVIHMNRKQRLERELRNITDASLRDVDAGVLSSALNRGEGDSDEDFEGGSFIPSRGRTKLNQKIEGGRLRGMKFHKGFVNKVVKPVGEVVSAVAIPVAKAVASVVAPGALPTIAVFDAVKKGIEATQSPRGGSLMYIMP